VLSALAVALADVAPALSGPRATPTLLGTYVFNGSQPNMAEVTYHPWQYATVYKDRSSFIVTDQTWANYGVANGGRYQGWDALLLPNNGVFRTNSDPNWLQIRMSRGATVAIVWRSNASQLPTWLSSWTLSSSPAPDWFCGGGSAQCPVYTKSVGAGTMSLGGVAAAGDPNPRDVYYVLFAEPTGQPAAQPVQLGVPAANANQTCPGWVHDQYVTLGPDGKTYPTWHPQIHPVYWCYFRHEHGSDPSLFSAAYRPAYGYTAAVMGEPEPHAGFKGYMVDDGQNHRWAITHHFGTGSLNRTCVRYHTMDLVLETANTSELLADVHVMADFGASVANTTGERLAPPACASQADAPTSDGSTGVREIPVVTRGGVMYEPWRFDGRGNILGLSGTLTFNTPDAAVICNDVACGQSVPTGNTGSYRHFESNRDFGISVGANSGVFYTDPRGLTLTGQGQPGAVRQFVKPGLSARLPFLGDNASCYTTDRWRARYRCTPPPLDGFPTNLEGALQVPN
jgi:hypothetical protein